MEKQSNIGSKDSQYPCSSICTLSAKRDHRPVSGTSSGTLASRNFRELLTVLPPCCPLLSCSLSQQFQAFQETFSLHPVHAENCYSTEFVALLVEHRVLFPSLDSVTALLLSTVTQTVQLGS